MAIDDNTTYGLTGAQIKELPAKIDAAIYEQMNTRLGGLTLLTISQTDYDSLQTYDANTLYVITGA